MNALGPPMLTSLNSSHVFQPHFSLVCTDWPHFMVQATTNHPTTCSVSRKKCLGRKLLCTDKSATLHIHQGNSSSKIAMLAIETRWAAESCRHYKVEICNPVYPYYFNINLLSSTPGLNSSIYVSISQFSLNAQRKEQYTFLQCISFDENQ